MVYILIRRSQRYLRDLIQDAIRGHNADYVEVRLEEAVSSQISYAGRELEDIGASSSRGRLRPWTTS